MTQPNPIESEDNLHCDVSPDGVHMSFRGVCQYCHKVTDPSKTDLPDLDEILETHLHDIKAGHDNNLKRAIQSLLNKARNDGWKQAGGEVLKRATEYERVQLEARLEGEQRAVRKIQAVINAHQGLNSDTEVLELVEASLQVIDKLELVARLKSKGA